MGQGAPLTGGAQPSRDGLHSGFEFNDKPVCVRVHGGGGVWRDRIHRSWGCPAYRELMLQARVRRMSPSLPPLEASTNLKN